MPITDSLLISRKKTTTVSHPSVQRSATIQNLHYCRVSPAFFHGHPTSRPSANMARAQSIEGEYGMSIPFTLQVT